MTVSRRTFLSGLAASGITVAIGFETGSALTACRQVPVSDPAAPYFSQWLHIDPSGKVRAYTSRCDLGQGFSTALTSALMIGLEVEGSAVEVVNADTMSCPDHGGTGGSTSTPYVIWGFWLACETVKNNSIAIAADVLDTAPEDLTYSKGTIHQAGKPVITLYELGGPHLFAIQVNSALIPADMAYADPDLDDVDGLDIVTGKMKYSGDFTRKRAYYGTFLTPPYHVNSRKLIKARLNKARKVDGVISASVENGEVVILAKGYPQLQKAAAKVKATWETPDRVKKLDDIAEILDQAVYRQRIASRGSVNDGLNGSPSRLEETYTTQYVTHCCLETDTAYAKVKGGKATVWVGSQNPYAHRSNVSAALGMKEDDVRVVGMRTGGAFGARHSHQVAHETARLAKLAGRPVKYVYSREDQFTRTGFMKLSSAFEIESGFDSAGILRAMKCICYQNSGGAVWLLYEIPNLLVTRYDADRPVNHVAMRAVDMVQGMFALESHLDMVADAAGKDPLEFRLKNARATGLTEALQTGAQAFGYTGRKTGANRGTGISIARWGDSRGALFAEVEVNTNSGKITVTRLVLAADVGTVVSSRSLIANLRGGLIMGLGYALMEEVKMDGHGINTKSLSEYSIPRFSDIPDIRIELYNRGSTEKFLGAGELPVPPVAPAIANAVFSATGKRIRNLPMIPSRVID